MIDPATHVEQARAARRYVIALTLCGEPPKFRTKPEVFDPLPPEPCEICGQPSSKGKPLPVTVQVKNPAILCRACRDSGYRARRCQCGRPLHTRDYASNSKLARRLFDLCGPCRKIRNRRVDP
jgi:hypothetical protein